MAKITDEIRAFLNLHRLGYVATVGPGQRPNVSPKGTIMGWDADSVVFANIRSPDTVDNLQHNPAVEISIIDPLARRGYLIEGSARVLDSGKLYGRVVQAYRDRGVKSPIRSVVMVRVAGISKVVSPLYDAGATEEDIIQAQKKRLGLL